MPGTLRQRALNCQSSTRSSVGLGNHGNARGYTAWSDLEPASGLCMKERYTRVGNYTEVLLGLLAQSNRAYTGG